MSEKELINEEGAVETVAELATQNGNVIAKVAVEGVVVAAGVAVVLYIRKKRANELKDDYFDYNPSNDNKKNLFDEQPDKENSY